MNWKNKTNVIVKHRRDKLIEKQSVKFHLNINDEFTMINFYFETTFIGGRYKTPLHSSPCTVCAQLSESQENSLQIQFHVYESEALVYSNIHWFICL